MVRDKVFDGSGRRVFPPRVYLRTGTHNRVERWEQRNDSARGLASDRGDHGRIGDSGFFLAFSFFL
jgi:hypothetical protein